MPSEAASAPNGVIHDIGYQRYTGPRLGRWYAVRSLYVHSVRTAFGLGRSGKAKVFPWLVVGIAFAVALIAVAVRSQSNTVLISYLQFPGDQLRRHDRQQQQHRDLNDVGEPEVADENYVALRPYRDCDQCDRERAAQPWTGVTLVPDVVDDPVRGARGFTGHGSPPR